MEPNDHGPAGAGIPSDEVLSRRFIRALAPVRDHLYAVALAKSASPAAAESALQKTARQLFHKFATDPHLDISAAMQSVLAPSAAAAPSTAAAATDLGGGDTPMPADAWARLAAAVQFEAASSHSSALHPDSVLLQPDPLLAPKKTRPRTDDTPFDVASPARLLTLLAAVILVGLLITLYILTRPPHAAPHNPPPATAPGAP